jgi:hypothetical protein
VPFLKTRSAKSPVFYQNQRSAERRDKDNGEQAEFGGRDPVAPDRGRPSLRSAVAGYGSLAAARKSFSYSCDSCDSWLLQATEVVLLQVIRLLGE